MYHARASHGFVYSSVEAVGEAMNDYHKDCDCEPVPSWDAKNLKIEGYEPDKLCKQYSVCRAVIENLLTKERYRKIYVETFVPKYEGDKPKDFDWWIAKRINKPGKKTADAVINGRRVDYKSPQRQFLQWYRWVYQAFWPAKGDRGHNPSAEGAQYRVSRRL